MSIAPAPTAPSTNPATPAPAPPPPRAWNPLAALLSYLVPGLGQISQGRVGKGVLFFVCIYALFFYGTVLGSGSTRISEPDPSNPGKVVTKEYRITSPVYLPADSAAGNIPSFVPKQGTFRAVYDRVHYLGQFWVGIAAWPAIWQYNHYDPEENRYADSIFGAYQRAPDQKTENAVNTAVGRILDLGWVLTVIAGVLNILVIYDALAGPAFLTMPTPETKAT